ncbi:MAG: sigma-70 family RNA polymerase sigma factor [Chlorobi bacterium]|nr:sigma-70 family RNA polymerase sigma factor [Chlorobiota bacterium]
MNVTKKDSYENLASHLFRNEAGKMVSVLTRIFGLPRIEIAEDIVQDTFLKALDEWGFNNIPQNPQAWLYKVAKNKTIDYLRHWKHVQDYESDISHLLKSEWTLSASVNNMFLDNEIQDSQLRMIFTSCHPLLPQESQIALTLKTLCGFSIKEISRALLTTGANVNKRLFRAKQKLRDEHLKFEIPMGDELAKRLDSVYRVIYLIFNEGYSSTESEKIIRKDLCAEALRLCQLLSEHKIGDNPKTYALFSLMCFHSSRFNARIDDKGYVILLKEQDRKLWNKALIAKGFEYLSKSSYGNELSEYHLEAGIASYHLSAKSLDKTNWNSILKLYEILEKINPSPVTILNKAIVVSQISGPQAALEEVLKIKTLEKYYLYHTTLAELYKDLDQIQKAKTHLEEALKLTNSAAEISLIKKRIEELKFNRRFL